MSATLQQIAQRIKQANGVVICTHMRPDGDAFGSSLALSCALEYLKIPHQVCVETEIPSNLKFINGIEKVKKYPDINYDLMVLVDCADEQRLGLLHDEFLSTKRKKIDTINIDHHVSNTRYATYNYVMDCAANCMNVAALIDELGAPLDKCTAEYLMIGLLTDSGNFAHDDVNEQVFLLAAKLIKTGIDIRYLNDMLFKKQPHQRAALYAETMKGMRYFLDRRFACIVITQENMNKYGADNGMTEGFVDFPLSVDGVEVAASIMEVKKRQYKVSLRSKEYVNVNKIAGVYGGGGHVRAAGCMLFGEIEEILDKLTYTVSQYLED